MSVQVIDATEAAHALERFDSVIDVRSPSEYAEDHLPGALNWPVLDDAERARVGTLYVQVSPHEARKVGAAIVAHNIARHLDAFVHARPKEWQPLVYCWRGGQRSGALAWFLGQIGFRTRQLGGGYKAFRGVVRRDLETLPRAFEWRVVAGRTGSGKTRLLHALERQDAQVLDLEALACHRGSVLGALPDTPQPSQKAFDTAIWQRLSGFDRERPVFVESESRKVGRLQVPEPVLEQMRERGRCVSIALADAARVALLLEDYAHLTRDAERFCPLLDALVELRGKDTVRGWQALARAGRWSELFADLMARHYDPTYDRSMQRHFSRLAETAPIELADAAPVTLQAAAAAILRKG